MEFSSKFFILFVNLRELVLENGESLVDVFHCAFSFLLAGSISMVFHFYTTFINMSNSTSTLENLW
jgi:hypothetical protein